MFEQAMLAEQFQNLLAKEQEAADFYAGLEGKVIEPGLKQQIEQLAREKQRHVELTQRLLEIVD